MSVKSEIKSIASSLTVGETLYVVCPVCQKKRKTMGITKFKDLIKFHCFSASCNKDKSSGHVELTLSKEAMQDAINKKTTVIEQVKSKSFELPRHLIQGFVCQEAIEMANKYDILQPYIEQKTFKTATDLRLMRQVFFYEDLKGNIIGASGRALIRGIKKAYVYPYSIKTPWVLPFANSIGSPPHCAVPPSNIGIIVEDIFSAIKAYSIGYTGIALSGTSLQKDWLKWFKGYDRLYIALDKDAANKAFEIKKLLDLYCESVIIVLLNQDLKDMNKEKAKELFV